jgi:hypothetical protein
LIAHKQKEKLNTRIVDQHIVIPNLKYTEKVAILFKCLRSHTLRTFRFLLNYLITPEVDLSMFWITLNLLMELDFETNFEIWMEFMTIPAELFIKREYVELLRQVYDFFELKKGKLTAQTFTHCVAFTLNKLYPTMDAQHFVSSFYGVRLFKDELYKQTLKVLKGFK